MKSPIRRWLAQEIIHQSESHRQAVISIDARGEFDIVPYSEETAATSFFNGSIHVYKLPEGGTELEFREYGGRVHKELFR
ncbi:MAG: hypothetical protein K2M55_02290 [Muribaculaceae bacterium]|nr:hypothetical protein [Muribaculaceae bacterium]